MYQFFIGGGPIMYPLLFCSIVVLTVVVERLMFWNRIDRDRSPALVDEVLELSRQGDWETVREKTRNSRDYIVKILVNGILHRQFSMIKAMESAAADEIRRMRRFMTILDTMITVAPLLGIFGTVLGIIQSFDVLGTAGIEHPEAVTAGIAQALITTAAGLSIAFPIQLAYNYFTNRVNNFALLMETTSAMLLETFSELEEQKGN